MAGAFNISPNVIRSSTLDTGSTNNGEIAATNVPLSRANVATAGGGGISGECMEVDAPI